ncbi:hypothetical protein QBC35DRAFT_554383 [Podospora australis]|uniref:Uncharacterized protein n=1 Tax=Podospora australis TaxID=1536484 RepID=A0AAN7AHV7_9PEZI|nr:hypothetical protein QBC35DRAFT_554383 [Podospora australis]
MHHLAQAIIPLTLLLLLAALAHASEQPQQTPTPLYRGSRPFPWGHFPVPNNVSNPIPTPTGTWIISGGRGPTAAHPPTSFKTTPYAHLTTFVSPRWTTVPRSQLTGDPFCLNHAAPQQGVNNHCVCKNGATIEIIPRTKGMNMSNYQPCAYTTIG